MFKAHPWTAPVTQKLVSRIAGCSPTASQSFCSDPYVWMAPRAAEFLRASPSPESWVRSLNLDSLVVTGPTGKRGRSPTKNTPANLAAFLQVQILPNDSAQIVLARWATMYLASPSHGLAPVYPNGRPYSRDSRLATLRSKDRASTSHE